MLRGNHGQDIFFSDVDRYNMCFLLQEGVERYGHRIHSYCFMSNHIHLLVQVGELPLSKIMQNLAFRFSQKMNQRYQRQGRLFQGRFKSILIKEEIYFTRLLRYIHMNPVRAKITDRPENYVWSSHNVYLHRNEMSWITTEYGLSKFGQTKKAAISRYISHVFEEESEEELEELRSNFKDGQVLGDDDFLEIVRSRNAMKVDRPISLEAIIEGVCGVLNIRRELVVLSGKSYKGSFARGMISVLAAQDGKIPIESIALAMQRDASTISSLISRFNEKHSNLLETKNEMEKAKLRAIEIAELQA
jgi:REP element-mobilizing transposase RayT